MADVSSYNLPVRSLADNVNDIQGMQSKALGIQQQQQSIQNNAISIDKNKLDLMNTQFGLINSELSNLAATPNITKDQALQRLNTFATTYKLPPEAVQHMTQELQQAPDVKSFAEFALRRGMDVQTKINQTYGTPSVMENGQQKIPGITKPAMAGGGFAASGKPIQQQIPPTAPTVDQAGQPSYVGPRTPQSALPVGNVNPVQSDRVPISAPPMFEEGKKQLTEDQNLASTKATALKPALQARDLIKGLRTGPGTETWNKAIAFAKANNIIPTNTKDDPTAIYQEVDKYLNQYLKGRGDRSDADLQAAAKSSPNPGIQINPALVKLLSSAIAQDRMEIARPAAFEDNNYAKYGTHKATFANKLDQRAFELDSMEPKERAALINDMKAKRDTPAGKKFWDSLRIAHKQGLLDQ